MALIQLPAKFGLAKVNKWGLMRAGNVVRSKYTGSRQAIVYPYAMWVIDATLIDYPEPEAAAIRAFFTQLQGQANTFQLPVPGYTNPSTGEIDANIVNAVTIPIGATTASLKALTPNKTILNPGDYFTIYDELKIATSTLVADATGSGSVNFLPPMRKQVDSGLTTAQRTCIINNPYVLLAADNEDSGIFGIGPPTKHGFDLKASEAF